MKKTILKYLIFFLFIFLGNMNISNADPVFSFTGTIKSISDGDTIMVNTGSNTGTGFKVRLLGFDTPEKYLFEIKDYKYYGCGKSATYFAEDNLEIGGKYGFYLDDLAKEEDDYGRKLRSVKLGTGALTGTGTYGYKILSEGLASFYQYENHAFTGTYKSIDDTNKVIGKGMYNEFCKTQDTYIKANGKRNGGGEIYNIRKKVLKSKNNFYYQLQNAKFDELKTLTGSIIFLEKDDIKLTPEQFGQLKANGNILIAYLSIGEAETYRKYWNSDWVTSTGALTDQAPDWLGEKNPNWNSYKVKYWLPGWQNIVFSRIDELKNAGYDGILLDVVDSYSYWKNNKDDSKKVDDADDKMVSFVGGIRKHLGDYLAIIPNGGHPLVEKDGYLDLIDGMLTEDVFYDYSKQEERGEDGKNWQTQYLDKVTGSGKVVFDIDYVPEEKGELVCKYYDFIKSKGYLGADYPIALDSFNKILCKDSCPNGDTSGNIKDGKCIKTEKISDYKFPTLNIIKRNNWLSVKDFGAKGDGITDDTASIQAAFDDLSMKDENLTLYFPEGTYLISDTLKLGDYKTPDEESDEFSRSRGDNIIGHGKKTILKWNGGVSTGAMIQDYGFSYSNIEGLVFDGNGEIGDGIYHKSITNFNTAMTHKNLAFFNFTNAAIRSRGSLGGNPATAELLLDNLLFVNNHKGISIGEGLSGSGAGANDYDWILENSEFVNNDVGVATTYGGQIQVKKTHFEGSKDTDLWSVNEASMVTSSGSNMFYKDTTCNSNPMFTNMKDVYVSNWTNNIDKKFSKTNSTIIPAGTVMWYGKVGNLTLADSSFNGSPLKNTENPPFNLHNCYKTESTDKTERQSDKKLITSNLTFDSEFTQTSTGFYKGQNTDSIKITDIPVNYSEDEKVDINSSTRFLNTEDYTEDFIIDITCKKGTSCESNKIFGLDNPVELSTDTYKVHGFGTSKAIEEAIELANTKSLNGDGVGIIYLPGKRDYQIENTILINKGNFTIEGESGLRTSLIYRGEGDLGGDLEIGDQKVNGERVSGTGAFFEINGNVNVKLKKLKILNDRVVGEKYWLTVPGNHDGLIVKKGNIILDQFKNYNIYKNGIKFENYDKNSTTYFTHSSGNLEIINNKGKLFIDSHFGTMYTSGDNSEGFIGASFVNPGPNVDQDNPVVFDIGGKTDVVFDYVYVEGVDGPVYNLSGTGNLTVGFGMRHHMFGEDYLKLNNYNGDVNFIGTIFSKSGDPVGTGSSKNKSNYEKFSGSGNVNLNFVGGLFNNTIKTEDKDPLNGRIFNFGTGVNLSYLNSISEYYQKQDNDDYPYKRHLSDIPNTENFDLESVKNGFKGVNKLVKEDFKTNFFLRNFSNASEQKDFFHNSLFFLEKIKNKISIFKENFLGKKTYLEIPENTNISDKNDKKISKINIPAPKEREKNILKQELEGKISEDKKNFPNTIKKFYELKNNFGHKIKFSKKIKIKIPVDNLKAGSKLKFLNEETGNWEILGNGGNLVEENGEKFLETEINELDY